MLEELDKYEGRLVEIKLKNWNEYKDPIIVKPLQYLEEDYLSYLVEKQDSKRLLEIEEDDLIYVKPADSSSWSL